MNIGFIGCGNMAKAMLTGLNNNNNNINKIYVSDISTKKLNNLDELKINNLKLKETNVEVAEKSDIIILAVKPKFYEDVIKEICNVVDFTKIIISITIGYNLQDLQELFNKNYTKNNNVKIIRAMPNTPAMISEGMTALCKNEFVSEMELKTVCDVFKNFSKVEIFEEDEEDILDSVVAVSGSAPAYVYMFIEALADGAVLQGMPRDLAYKFASQTVLGSAKMVLETNMHPAQLKDEVCSPSGSTIEAVRVLEDKGFRSAIIEAMTVCSNKASNNKKIK